MRGLAVWVVLSVVLPAVGCQGRHFAQSDSALLVELSGDLQFHGPGREVLPDEYPRGCVLADRYSVTYLRVQGSLQHEELLPMLGKHITVTGRLSELDVVNDKQTAKRHPVIDVATITLHYGTTEERQ